MSELTLFVSVFLILTSVFFLMSLVLWLLLKIFHSWWSIGEAIVLTAQMIIIFVFSVGILVFFAEPSLALIIGFSIISVYFVLTLYYRWNLTLLKIIGVTAGYLMIGLWAVLFVGNPLSKGIIPVVVSGESMSPTLHTGDYIIMKRMDNEIKRGDIVVFHYPENSSRLLVKRVVALPNDLIQIRDQKIFVNEILVKEEEYLGQEIKTPGNISYELKSSEYFVLGDNREQALDSRQIGPIERNTIIGRIIFH